MMKRMISTLAAFIVASMAVLPLDAAAYTFSGTIYESGTFGTRRLPNATVRFMPGNYVTTSASNGAYALSVPAGTYMATITGTAHIPETHQIVVTGDRVRDFSLRAIETQVRFNLAGSVQERLLDGSTRALAGAAVVVNPGSIRVTSDASGRFALSNLAAGIYTVTASASGHRSASQKVSLTANADISLVLPVTGTVDNGGAVRTVTGTIVANTGGGISGATIRLTPGNVRATTDVNGNFTFQSVRPGRYTAHVRASGFRPLNQRVTIGSTGTVSLVMTRASASVRDDDDDDNDNRVERRNRGNDDDRGRGRNKGKSGKRDKDD